MTVTSVLAADFGSVYTRAVLIDVVDGSYRLVARGQTRTTDGFPVDDLAVGLDRVLRQMTDATGRRFTNDSGQIITPEQEDRSGVDAFVVTSSVGRPLRAVIVGLMPEVSIASALRAAAGTYLDTATTLHIADGRSEEERLNAVLLTYPDVIFIVGGTEEGAPAALLRLLNPVRTAVALLNEFRRPSIIYAGNSALAATVQAAFDPLTDVFVAANVRPALEEETVDSARLQLAQAFDRYAETRSAAFTAISAMSTSGVLPTPQSYNLIVDYLGRVYPGGVAAVDVGSAASILAVSFDQKITTSIRTDIGLGHNAPALLETVGVDPVRKWLPFNVTDSDLQNYVANKALRPASIPETLVDLYLEHALLKAGIEAMAASARPSWKVPFGPISIGRVIGAGSALTNTGHAAYDALLLLDALQPAGVSLLQNDPYGLIAGLGALAFDNPEAVVQVVEGDNLETLGTAVAPVGRPRTDRPAMRVEITLSSGEKIDQTVMGGHLWVYPLPYGYTAEVRIRLMGGLRINNRTSLRLTLTGGGAGLIFDARGRPLVLASDVRERAVQFPLWVSEVTGDPVQEIDPRLLEAVQVQAPVVGAQKRRRPERSRPARPARGGRRGRKQDAKAPAGSTDELEPDLLEFIEEEDLDDLRRGL